MPTENDARMKGLRTFLRGGTSADASAWFSNVNDDDYTALDVPATFLDAEEKDFVEQIREHGWITMIINDDEGLNPSFAYSTGFWKTVGFPEVIAFSLDPDDAHATLSALYSVVANGNPPEIGVAVPGFLNKVILLPCSQNASLEHLTWTRWFYQDQRFDILQLVWSDEDGHFPWESGFDKKYEGLQADLSVGGWRTAH